MYEGLEGEKHILHFLDDRIQMQHVYCIPNKRQETILPTVKNFEALITRHWDHRFRICKSDNEAGLGNAFDQWVIQNGFTHEKSPTHTPEQNGAIERSGRTLATRARTLITDAHLPKHLWPEVYMAAGYLIEPSPTRSLDWQRPVGAFLSLKKGTEFKIPLHHLKAYGCKAYVHKPTATTRQLDRLDPKAHIGYLVSYESTNIYRIWIPVLSRAETTRDVRFDEDSFYDRHIGIIQDIDWIAEQLASITLWAPTQLQEDDIKSTAYAEPEDYLVRMVTLPQSMPTQPTQTAEALTPLKEDIVSENVNCLLTPTPTPSLRRQAYVAA